MIPADFKTTFTDSQLEQIERHPGYVSKTQSGKVCPVCLNEGRYAYQGKEYECPVGPGGIHVALRLSMLYFLHNIPIRYQKLIWAEWPTDTDNQREAKEAMDYYVANFERGGLNGEGLTFFSSGLGTGKTWGATSTLKRLVKSGVDGWFAPFYEVKSYYDIEDRKEREFKIKRVQTADLLVLDEVREPGSDAQKRFFADELEALIRPRADNDFPTIITTNMTPDVLEKVFPRVFSLIWGKNLTIDLTGADYRLSDQFDLHNRELQLNGEAWPIT